MKYDVTRRGPGGHEIITVEAESGDEAAQRAWKPGTVIGGVVPSEVQEDAPKKRGRPSLQGEDA